MKGDPGVAAPTWSRTCRLATCLSGEDIARYAEASGDWNRIHVDEAYARAGGHPSLVAHGMLTMGLTGAFLAQTVGHANVRCFGGRFLRPVHAGDSLDCTITLASWEHRATGADMVLDLRTSTTDGAAVFVGRATVVIPEGAPLSPLSYETNGEILMRGDNIWMAR